MFSENVMKFSTETPKAEEDTIVTLATETNVSIDDLGMSFSFSLHQMSQYSHRKNNQTGYMYPTDWVCRAINALHETVGLEWYQSIILATIVARFTLFPLAVTAMRGTSRLAYASPEMKPIQEAYKNNQISQQEMVDKLQAVYKKYGISSPLAPFAGIVAQMPIFISFFMALRQLPDYVDLSSGGLMWFADLSAPDATYILPATAAAGFLATIELNADGVQTNEQSKNTKNIMRFLGIMILPMSAQFPTALLLYWNTSNLFSLAQVGVFKIPGVKPALGILPPPNQSGTPPPMNVINPNSAGSKIDSSRVLSEDPRTNTATAEVASSPTNESKVSGPSQSSTSSNKKRRVGRRRRRSGKRK